MANHVGEYTSNDIVAYARTWLGALWRHQGRGNCPRRGIDCAGLIVRTMMNFNIPHVDITGYGRAPGRQFANQLEKYTDPADINGNLNGVIAVFSDTIMPCHTGILAQHPVTGKVTVIHAECYPKRRVHEESFTDSTPSLRDRLTGVRLFRGTSGPYNSQED